MVSQRNEMNTHGPRAKLNELLCAADQLRLISITKTKQSTISAVSSKVPEPISDTVGFTLSRVLYTYPYHRYQG